MLITSHEGLILVTAQGEVLWGPTRPPEQAEPPRVGCWVHPVAIADMDGDGLPEAIVNTCEARMILRIDKTGPTILASVPTRITYAYGAPENGSTALRRSSGPPDWVAFDHTNLKLLAGMGPAVQTNHDLDFHEYQTVPVIADVDNDGSADLVVCHDGQLTVYEDGLKRPIPARRIYNQYNYWVTNVREDGTIPAHAVMPWDSRRTSRVQAPRACTE